MLLLLVPVGDVVGELVELLAVVGLDLGPGGNCIKIGLPGKSILRDYFQENMTSRRPFLLLRISFPGRPIFIQFVPAAEDARQADRVARGEDRR